MAISIVKQPTPFQPAYNPMIISLTSSNVAQTSFQFVSDIYVRGNWVTRMKIPVNPDGYGVFDIHRHVENSVSFDFNPSDKYWTIATNSFATYSVNFSEEFRFEWPFYDNQFTSGSLSFIGGTTPLFNVGDEIFVTQEDNATEPGYSGYAQITSITMSGTYSLLVTNKPFTTATPVNPGTVSLFNFGLNILTTTQSTGELDTFNGVVSFEDYINWDWTDWEANNVAPYGKFLTNVPDNYKVGTQSRMWLNVYQADSNDVKDLMIESNKGTFRFTNSFVDPGTYDQYSLLKAGVGPYQLLTYTSSITNQGTASFPIIDDDTTEYTIYVKNQILQQTIASKTFKIDRTCSRYEPIQLVFMDKMGSFVPFTFTRVSRNTTSIDRKTWGQNYGSFAPATNNWNYNSWDRGTRTLDTVVNEKWVANSDWVDSATSDYLMELFQSPEVYWIKDNGTTVAINITTTGVERKQTINDQIINYTIEFETSVKNSSQRG